MKKLNAFLISAFAAAVLNAATIDQVIVRQQWPWSTDVKVEFRLSGVDASHPVDLAVKAYNGDAELALPKEAIKGDLYGISDGIGTIIIDPIVAFGSEKVALANFKVKLSVSDAPENSQEVIYKVFDLISGACTDITRADLYNGKYGAYETDFAKIGPNFSTELDDVLIWTGVTNDIAYKTSKMVMRKIPAKNQSYTMLPGTANAHAVSFTNDYFVSVFELTEGQWLAIATNDTRTASTADPMRFTNERYRYQRPINGSFNAQMRSYLLWPKGGHETIGANSVLKALRTRLGTSAIDLPTEALWEYAARAGVWGGDSLPSGKPVAGAAATDYRAVCRYRFNAASQPYADGLSPKDCDPSDGTNIVGSYAPNAWGLYDVLGNVAEWCLDAYSNDVTSFTGADPWGPAYDEAWGGGYSTSRVYRGGSYINSGFGLNSRGGDLQTYTWSYIGFRLCLTVY